MKRWRPISKQRAARAFLVARRTIVAGTLSKGARGRSIRTNLVGKRSKATKARRHLTARDAADGLTNTSLGNPLE